jgi:hypothetical protein
MGTVQKMTEQSRWIQRQRNSVLLCFCSIYKENGIGKKIERM